MAGGVSERQGGGRRPGWSGDNDEGVARTPSACGHAPRQGGRRIMTRASCHSLTIVCCVVHSEAAPRAAGGPMAVEANVTSRTLVMTASELMTCRTEGPSAAAQPAASGRPVAK